MKLQKITEFYTEWFSICPITASKISTIATFKSFIKQNNDSNRLVGMSMIFYCAKLHLSKCKRFITRLHKIKYEFQLSTAHHVHVFCFTQKLYY
jgi:hypothetical protein